MPERLSPKQLSRLDIQGFDRVDPGHLAEVAPWLRLAFGLCAALAILGTALASVPLLLVLAAIALGGGLSPVHPFDVIYNRGVRRVTGTRPLPKRGAPARFACGLGSLWLLATVVAFQSAMPGLGYVLGFALAGVAILVATIDVCIPSMIFRAVFGGPEPRRAAGREAPAPTIPR